MKSDELTIEVTCRHLPGIRFADYEPVYLGIQKGTEVIEAVPGDRKQVTFQPVFKVGTQPNGSPNFLGPFAKGTPHERFFYLSWGVMTEDGRFEMFRRAKIHLNHLTREQINSAFSKNRPIRVTLDMTDLKGAPLCASVRKDRAKWEL